MTIWKVTFTLDDAIPAQAAILTTVRNNITVLTDGGNKASDVEIIRVG